MNRPRRRLRLRALPVREYVRFHVVLALATELVQAALIAGLAVSRAGGHRLSATEAGIIVALAPIFGAFSGAILSYFLALSEGISGLVVPDDNRELRPVDGDPLAARSVWGRSFRAALTAAVWGAGLGALMVAVLNRRDAGFPVLFAGIAVATLATATTGLVIRMEALRAAFHPPSATSQRAARRRAWRDLALPLASFLALANGSFTWILFHSYAVGVQFGTHVLTEQQVLADIPVLVLLNALLPAYICGRAGRSEAAMKLVAFEDASTQVPEPKNGFGVQAIVYSVVAVILLTSLVRFLLPALPNLAEAIAARAFLAGAIAFLVGGFSYIRGAGNVAGGAAPVVAAEVAR